MKKIKQNINVWKKIGLVGAACIMVMALTYAIGNVEATGTNGTSDASNPFIINVTPNIQLQAGEYVDPTIYISVLDAQSGQLLVKDVDYWYRIYSLNTIGSTSGGTHTWSADIISKKDSKKYQEVSLTYTVLPPTTQAPAVTTETPESEKIVLTAENTKVEYKVAESGVSKNWQVVDKVYYNGQKLTSQDIIITNLDGRTKANKLKSTGTATITGKGKYKGSFTVPVTKTIEKIQGNVTVWKFLQKYADCGLYVKSGNWTIGRKKKGYVAEDAQFPTTGKYYKFQTKEKDYKDEDADGNWIPNNFNYLWKERTTGCTPATLKKQYTASNADTAFINAMLDDFEKIPASQKRLRVCNQLYNDVAKAAAVVNRTVKVEVRTPGVVKKYKDKASYSIYNYVYNRAYVDCLNLGGSRKGITKLAVVDKLECKIKYKGSNKWEKYSTSAIGPYRGLVDDWSAYIVKKGKHDKDVKACKARFYRTVNGKKYYSKWVTVK